LLFGTKATCRSISPILKEIAFDRWSARQMMDALAEDGLPVVEFPQNLATFAQPVIEFERGHIRTPVDPRRESAPAMGCRQLGVHGRHQR
jgi:hypothetical protein